MVDAGEQAYAYVKACGIIGKSFVGKRIAPLAGLHSLNEFDRLVFSDAARELPGRELLTDLEGRVLRRTVSHILAVAGSYEQPPELLVRQIRSWEYADLKSFLHHLSGGIKSPPLFCDLGRFGTLRLQAYPDLKAMLSGTEFDFILSKNIKQFQSADFDTMPLEAELDLRYYTLLLESLRRLPPADRFHAERIIADEISLRNCTWALRLRTYFKKTGEDTAQYLMNLNMQDGQGESSGSARFSGKNIALNSGGAHRNSLAAQALKSLELPLDSRAAWKGWRWERFLNPETGGDSWAVDPRFFQNAASEYLYRLSFRCFRRTPFTTSAVFCYIKLKQFEEDLLTSVIEGLGLGMPAADVFDLLGASSTGGP